ncbi:cupin domain-containing protein [Nitrososphaera viennensis]|uniref:Cupin domain-containing protein n=2 Tax=Nitrososphaera viennensis TaxID=1034015 RepID=A0A977NP73_9ARCH|nr:cupin domain-containing protein [Nitrososphaera viennensis]AIC15600.1 putative enolase [Nitrososphaera viennensis EN76]UVS70475.1 cupin domain-containing protein [Nitrososphaera viennensis]
MFFKALPATKTVDARAWVRALGLKEHPEGGYFKETYRAEMEIDAPGFGGRRSAGTAIYYLLKSGQFSAFHRIKSDEVWHFYAGSPLAVHVIDREGGKYHKMIIGRSSKRPALQAVVKAGCWFAASVDRARSYSLAGCTVAPGFDFRDWEVGRRGELLALYPEHRQVIEKFTRQ